MSHTVMIEDVSVKGGESTQRKAKRNGMEWGRLSDVYERVISGIKEIMRMNLPVHETV